MRRTVLLTHIVQPSMSWYQSLKMAYNFNWVPLAKGSFNPDKIPLSGIKYVIASSPTSIQWLAKNFDLEDLSSKSYFVVAQNSRTLLQQKLGDDYYPHIHLPEMANMTSLLKSFAQYEPLPSLWLGSHLGLLRYRRKLQKFPHIFSHLTHWNWPNWRLTQQESAVLIHSDILVISSICAACSLNYYIHLLKKEAIVILSDTRLRKYITVPRSQKVISGRWTEILEQLACESSINQ